MAARPLLRVVVAGVALVGSLLAVELGCRIAGIGGPYDTRDLALSWKPAPPYQKEGPAGMRMAPGYTGALVYQDAAGNVVREVPVRTNELGLRGPATPASIDVLALGDSVTFGQGVEEDEAWPAVLARTTGKAVVNAGTPAWNIEQEAAWLDAMIDALRPRVVVLAWFVNDLDGPGLLDASQPHPTPLEVPDWVASAPRTPSWGLNAALRRIRQRAFAEAVLGDWADYREGLTARAADPYIRSGKRAAFVRVASACTRVGSTCLVITLPLIQVADDPGVTALTDGARQDAEAAGLRARDLSALVAAVPMERRVVHPSDPHPSAEVHAAIAAAVAEMLSLSPTGAQRSARPG